MPYFPASRLQKVRGTRRSMPAPTLKFRMLPVFGSACFLFFVFLEREREREKWEMRERGRERK